MSGYSRVKPEYRVVPAFYESGYLVQRCFTAAWVEFYHRREKAWHAYQCGARPYRAERNARRIMAQLQALDAVERWAKEG